MRASSASLSPLSRERANPKNDYYYLIEQFRSCSHAKKSIVSRQKIDCIGFLGILDDHFYWVMRGSSFRMAPFIIFLAWLELGFWVIYGV